MCQRLGDRLIGVFKLRVLANNRNAHQAFRIVDPVSNVFPDGQIGLGRWADRKGVQNGLVHAFAIIGEGRLIDRFEILCRDHRIRTHIAEQRQLFALLLRDGAFGSADQNIGRNADRAQLFHRVLGGFRLQLARGRDIGQQREMHEQALSTGLVIGELADRLKEGQTFDIPHCAADFAQHEIHLVFADRDEILDLVCDVRNHLNGFAQVVAPALFLEHVGIDAPRGHAVGGACVHTSEAFVVAQVEVGLGAIIGDEHFAMLKRRHGAWIHVQIRVQLAQAHGVAACLKQCAQCSGGKAFAQ